jgi:hypothetical protein
MTIYETEADRANERAIIKMICERVGWHPKRVKKLPRLHELDWVIYRSNGYDVLGFLEIKRRPGIYFGYPGGYYIANTKVIIADKIRAARKLGTRLVVYFPNKPDEIWWTKLNGPYRTKMFGRDDRPDDPKAIEECAVIEWSDFEPVTASGA